MDEQLSGHLKLVFFVFLLLLCIWLLKMIFPVITLIIIALLIVYLIGPLVTVLEKYFHIPQTVAAALVFVLFLLLIFLILYLIPPMIFREMQQLAGYIATDFRHQVIVLFQQLQELEILEDTEILQDMEIGQTIKTALLGLIEQLPVYLRDWLNRISTYHIPFFREIWSLLGLLFLIFFLLLDFNNVKSAIIKVFPPRYQGEVFHVISVTDAKVGAYLRGNVVRCTIVGVFTWLGLYLMGMPFAFTLGIIAGLLNIIHNIGPFLASLPAIFISLTPGTPHPLLVIAIYLVIQTVDPFILTPILLGKAVDLRPITVVIAVLVGASLMGMLGIILSIPVTAVLKVLINHYYIKKMGIEVTEEGSWEVSSEAGEEFMQPEN